MFNLKFYIVSYDECRNAVVDKISESERNNVCCYSVNESHPKRITNKIQNVNEWDLNWHDETYQDLQYYEYSLIPHIAKNESLIENISHIGLLHFDTYFKSDSINEIKKDLIKNPNQIYYMVYIKDPISLYMSRDQLDKMCLYMSSKLKMFINANIIWNIGWISHAMVIAPTDVYIKFGKFMVNNKQDFENMIRNKTFGPGHRPCGLMERMWGFYLVSLGLPIKKIDNIVHDSTAYEHKAWRNDFKNFKL
jgi:hypothetical protein